MSSPDFVICLECESPIYTFEWDGTNRSGLNVSTGIYFARFVAGDVKMTRKMILLK